MVLSKRISIKAERIKVIKDWLKPKSVRNIQVFLGFASFYWRFIQNFNRIVALLFLILKTTGLPDKPAPSKNNSNKSVFYKNDNSKPAFGKNDGDSEIDGFGISGNGIKHAKKLEKLSKLRKLSKSRKSKSKKMSKSWNLAKSRKKLSKSGNLTNFNAIEAGPKFLTPDAKTIFNRLWLAFTEAPILWHFDPKCYIWIKINALDYAIGEVLSQLTSRTNYNGVVTRTNLGQW